MAGGHAWRGACVAEGCVTPTPRGQILQLRHTVNERAVRILLKCILVFGDFHLRNNLDIISVASDSNFRITNEI